jgi:hypothetical protein
LFAASIESMALLTHFISSIRVQWVMLQCYEGSMRLILDMPCPLGTASQAKTKVVCSQHTASMALLNHFISSVWVQWVMLQNQEGYMRLIFGHAMSSWHCSWKSKPSSQKPRYI